MRRSARTGSVELRARRLYFLLRELAIALEERRELLGRLADRLEAKLRQSLPEVRRVDDLRRLGGELRDDVARRGRGRREREIERGVEVAQPRLGEGRHLRDQRMALSPRDGES